MNNYDLLQILGEIDDGMLERTAHFRERRDRILTRRIRLPHRQIGLVAACLILLLCAVPVAKRLMNGATPGVIPPDSQPVTDVVENPDFVIENGVLLSYVGDETDIVIPEGVVKIAQQAFLSAPEITSIHLPESLEDIEPLTFAELLSLDTLTVVETNKFYKVIDKILIKQNGTLVCLQNIESDSMTSGGSILHDAISLLKDNGFMESFIKKIEIGNALMELDESGYYLKEITVFGKNISLDGGAFYLYGNLKFQAFEVNHQFVVSSVEERQKEDGTYNGHYRKTIIVTKDAGVVTVCTKVSRLMEDLCSSVITFFEENGKLYYKRVPNKYYNIQVLAGELEYCVSKDELYEEIGTVNIENGNITYYPKQITTVSDAFDLEQDFILWRDEVAMLDSDLTLDDYLQSNSQKFSKAT